MRQRTLDEEDERCGREEPKRDATTVHRTRRNGERHDREAIRREIAVVPTL